MKIDITKNNVWFTSDTHFYHEFIIKVCNRPFNTIEEMHEAIINNWNDVVKDENDHVFLLGDFAFTGKIELIKDLVDSLTGKIHLIHGNHDYQNKLTRNIASSLFESANDYLDLKILDPEIEDGTQRLFLCHYPMNSWAGSQVGSWNLFGHIHSRPYSYNTNFNPYTMDVGMDAHNFTPISYQTVKELITKQSLAKAQSERFKIEKYNLSMEQLEKLYFLAFDNCNEFGEHIQTKEDILIEFIQSL